MRLPHVPLSEAKDLDIGIVGIPWDGGTTNRPGPRHGPRQMRDASSMVRRMHQTMRIVPYDLANVADLGDCPVNPADVNDGLKRVQTYFKELVDKGIRPLSAGGEVCCTTGFNALKFFSWMTEVRPTWYTAVPPIHRALISLLALRRVAHPMPVDAEQADVGAAFSEIPRELVAELESHVGLAVPARQRIGRLRGAGPQQFLAGPGVPRPGGKRNDALQPHVVNPDQLVSGEVLRGAEVRVRR
jgi:hypothetical protein